MFTEAQIAAAVAKLNPADETNGTLTERNRNLLLGAMRRYVYAHLYPDLETKLAAAIGINAAALQAALDLLQTDEARAGDAAKRGGKSAVFFSKAENRQDILESAFAILYKLKRTIFDKSAVQRGALQKQTRNPASARYKARIRDFRDEESLMKD